MSITSANNAITRHTKQAAKARSNEDEERARNIKEAQDQCPTEKLIEISGLKDVTQEVCPNLYRPIDIHYQHGDSSNLVNLTGWKPEIGIDQTLADLLKYWYDKIN